MSEPISSHEMRRRAPGHFWAKADNARFAAALLWHSMSADQAILSKEVNYTGTTHYALYEAFQREAAISLELIIKTAIAQRIEFRISSKNLIKVRPTHDLEALWQDAELPSLQSDDYVRLLIAKRLLFWSGRYAAPLKDKDYEREIENFEKHKSHLNPKNPKIKNEIFLGWEDFDRIYCVVVESIGDIINRHHPYCG